MIGVQQCAECWLVLGGPWKACLQPHKIGQSPTRMLSKTRPQPVGVFACLEGSLSAFLQSPCRNWVMNYNVIGRWAYQAKKEEEEQMNVVFFVNEN
jgi:hypothetical protein